MTENAASFLMLDLLCGNTELGGVRGGQVVQMSAFVSVCNCAVEAPGLGDILELTKMNARRFLPSKDPS